MKAAFSNSFRIALLASAVVALTFSSCKKDDDDVTNETPSFRGTKIDYNSLTETTPYNNIYFVDSEGDSTVDRTEGHNRIKMLKALDAYAKTSNNAGTAVLSATTFNNMFINANSPFTGVYVPMNTVDENLREATALSRSVSVRDEVMDQFDAYFSAIANASVSVNDAASSGVPGKLTATNGTTKYLVTAQGLEMAQIISKSFIGAFQLDYISNVLLNTGLEADNTQEVEGHNYTALEHNWDVAYGTLTLNAIYAGAATTTSSGGESFIGSYVWEYNKAGYPLLHMAFLKGRAAIVNNDMTEVRAQAAIIRGILEKAIANAAIGYLGKWSTAADQAGSAHAIGEGGGFIYSLRFCNVNGADEDFSNDVISGLGLYSGNGFWDLTALKVSTASNAIKAKFGIL